MDHNNQGDDMDTKIIMSGTLELTEEESTEQDKSTFHFSASDTFGTKRSSDTMIRPICLLGLFSVMLGLLIIGIGIAAFVIIPSYKTRHSFQVESKWTNLVLIFGGFCSIGLTLNRSIVTICGTLIFSFLSGTFALATTAVHIANYYFRLLDTAYFEVSGNQTEFIHSQFVGRVYFSLAVVSSVSFIVSLALFLCTLSMVGRIYGFKVLLAANSLRLTVIGLLQIVAGLMITGLWISVETLFTGEGINLHALPSAEVLSHGLIVLCSGTMLMLAMGKGTKPLLVTATVSEGLVFAVMTFYGERSLSVMAFSLDQSRSVMGGNAVFESRMIVCIFLGALYMIMMLLSVYCFGKLMHMISDSTIPRLETIAYEIRRRMRLLSYVQCILALVYAIVDIMAIGMFVLYKLDFTPLPLFILCQGIFAYFGVYSYSPLLISAALAMSTFCGVYSVRDLYLFIYHVSKPVTPDSNLSGKMAMTGAKLAIHLCLVIVAIVEIFVILWLTILMVKVLMHCLHVGYNRFKNALPSSTISVLRLISGLQIIGSVVIIIFGFILFLGKSLYVETFGDVSITKGMLMLIASLFTMFQLKRPSLLISALFMQIFLFTVIILQTDSLAYFIDNHLGLPESIEVGPDDQHLTAFVRIQNKYSIDIAFANFALFLFNFLFIFIVILLLARLLKYSRFVRHPIDNQDEEMVTIKAVNLL